MSASTHDSSSSGRGAKIAIPRLERPPPPPAPRPSARNRDDRVVRACKTCRRRKIKCTGDGPPCSACQASSLDCFYEQGRRDRLKEATQQNAALGNLLRDLSGRVDSDDQRKIDDALAENAGIVSQEQSVTRNSLGKHARRRSDSDEEGSSSFGEAHITASAGSNEDLDHLDENISRDRESRNTGYFGKNSEVQWLSSVQRQTANLGAEPHGQPYGPPGAGRDAIAKRVTALHERRNQAMKYKQAPTKYITDSTFYLDSDELRSDIVVETDEIPPDDVAERLFRCYMDTVHSSFPLVPDDFEDSFHSFMTTRNVNDVSPTWRAQLNLILAIAAKYSHLIDAEWAADERDHFVYMKRATNLLELKDTLSIISGPDVPLVQATGALAFYFLAIGHVSRAWITIGMSLRLALALGLHLRNENPKATASGKETLVRLWWTLHAIESLISTITGRPPVLAIEDSTVPLPQSPIDCPPTRPVRSSQVPSIQSSPETRTRAQSPLQTESTPLQRHQFLIDHINLMRILQKALFDLYSPRTASQSWQVVQRSMSLLLKTLDTWSHAVSCDDFLAVRREQGQGLSRLRRLLVTEYWSIKMVITRPCLCRLERRIKNESNNSTRFNTAIAKTCVESAMEMVKLFPDKVDFHFIAMKWPWWATTHYIVQAVAVLLLETSYQTRDQGETTPEIIEAIKKMLRWLRVMEDNDPVAAKAYRVVHRILKTVAPILQSIADELLSLTQELDISTERLPSRRTNHPIQMTRGRDLSPNELPLAGPSSANAAFNFQPIRQDVPETLPDSTSTEVFDPELILQQPHSGVPASSYDSAMNPETYYDDRIAIGNPFFTEFDQDAPFAYVQGLWTGNTFDPNWPDVSNAWNHPGQDFDAEMEETSRP